MKESSLLIFLKSFRSPTSPGLAVAEEVFERLAVHAHGLPFMPSLLLSLICQNSILRIEHFCKHLGVVFQPSQGVWPRYVGLPAHGLLLQVAGGSRGPPLLRPPLRQPISAAVHRAVHQPVVDKGSGGKAMQTHSRGWGVYHFKWQPATQ